MPKSEHSKALDDSQLHALFAEARDGTPALPEGLATRMLADADAEQAAIMARRDAPRGAPAAAPRRGLAGILAAIGGWPAVAGLVSATVAGLWIGVSPPAVLAEEAAYYIADGTAEDLYLVDVMPGFGTFDATGADG